MVTDGAVGQHVRHCSSNSLVGSSCAEQEPKETKILLSDQKGIKFGLILSASLKLTQN